LHKSFTHKNLSFGWRQSFLLFEGNEKILHKNTQKSFSHILWLLWFSIRLCGIKNPIWKL
jgi:hypothetical protein